ncbi:DgyrCDS11861 [Dimorphilus gyrociliatus]|uniref:DgyrCDS11861 n=1 Tax=Dimorphilus gyrociliatus TaxID=2664684 RepID=A0A7I8W603_9ANNE|nr:DgyrCDS11861 [Dimorphilus gyrociliatus]
MADSPESQSIEKAIQTILKDFEIEVSSYLADLDAKVKMIEGKMTQIVDQQLYKLPEKYRSMKYDDFVALCDDDIEQKEAKNDVPSITSTLRGRRTRRRVPDPLTPGPNENKENAQTPVIGKLRKVEAEVDGILAKKNLNGVNIKEAKSMVDNLISKLRSVSDCL